MHHRYSFNINYIVILLFILALEMPAREWTSHQGTVIEAKYIASTDSEVTIQRNSDSRRFTIPLNQLSQNDQDWVAEIAKNNKGESNSNVHGPIHKLPKQLAEIVMQRGKVLMEDDFNREAAQDSPEFGSQWRPLTAPLKDGIKEFDIIDGEMRLTRSPKSGHALVLTHDTSEPYQEAISWTRAKFSKGNRFKIAFNDKQYKPVHAGHINAVFVYTNKIIIDDEKNGRFSAAAKKIKNDPSKIKERYALTAKYSRSFPVRLKEDQWFDIVTHHQGETLTVYINGRETGSYTSPGFAHETKRHFGFSPAENGSIDHTCIWKIGPADDQ